jgi:hypothetical protein
MGGCHSRGNVVGPFLGGRGSGGSVCARMGCFDHGPCGIEDRGPRSRRSGTTPRSPRGASGVVQSRCTEDSRVSEPRGDVDILRWALSRVVSRKSTQDGAKTTNFFLGRAIFAQGEVLLVLSLGDGLQARSQAPGSTVSPPRARPSGSCLGPLALSHRRCATISQPTLEPFACRFIISPSLRVRPACVRASWRPARGSLWTPFRVLGAVEGLSNLAVDESRTRGDAHHIRLRQRTVDTRRLDLGADSRPEG